MNIWKIHISKNIISQQAAKRPKYLLCKTQETTMNQL